MKISLSRNLTIALLIRRASRATFPDMGRLTDSPLPTIVVKIIKQFCFVFGFLLFAILLITLLYHLTALLPYQRLLLSPRLLMEARITVAFPCLGRWRATILDVFGVKVRKILKQNFDQDAVGGLVWCGNMN